MNLPQSRSARRESRRDASSGTAAAGRRGQAGQPGKAGQPEQTAHSAETEQPAQRTSRAGRNLPAAIGVGVGLGIVIIGSLLLRKELMLVIVVAAIAVGVWELRRGLAQVGIHVPLVPSLVGSVSMLVSAYRGGGQALVLTLGLTCIGILLWRIADGVQDAVRDTAGGFFVAVYPSFLAGFAALMLAPSDGGRRIIAFILVTVLSDVGGYAFGVLFGKHPMAPRISPKKSWEGMAGSIVACVLCASLILFFTFHAAWWSGLVFGSALAVSATIGDLGESLIKRDLGIKDMGKLLPGHGGIMDRLDSLLPSAAVAYLLLSVFAPV
jgi:phosphatidate cytidylyltransferase